MRKITFLLCLLTASVQLFCQNILHDPVTGRVFNSEKYSGIKGSPFLFDEWMTGTVTVPQGTYPNIELKLDAYNNTLLFRRYDGPREFADPVKGFTLMRNPADSSTYLRFRNALTGSGIRADQFLQIIAEGKVSIYRSDLKLMTDVNQINEGVIKTFTTSTRYYLLKDNGLQLIKMNKKDIFELMKDKEQQVDAFVSQNNLSTKKESDLARIVQYYNTL